MRAPTKPPIIRHFRRGGHWPSVFLGFVQPGAGALLPPMPCRPHDHPGATHHPSIGGEYCCNITISLQIYYTHCPPAIMYYVCIKYAGGDYIAQVVLVLVVIIIVVYAYQRLKKSLPSSSNGVEGTWKGSYSALPVMVIIMCGKAL
jgi:hypothetical protein